MSLYTELSVLDNLDNRVLLHVCLWALKVRVRGLICSNFGWSYLPRGTYFNKGALLSRLANSGQICTHVFEV
jgi:hypothetical protein